MRSELLVKGGIEDDHMNLIVDFTGEQKNDEMNRKKTV